MDFAIRYLKSVGLFLVILIPGTVSLVAACVVFGHPPFRNPPDPGWLDRTLTWDELLFISKRSSHLLPEAIEFGTSLFLMGQCMSLWGFRNWVRTAWISLCSGISCMMVVGISGLSVGLANRVEDSVAVLGMVYGATLLPRWTRSETGPTSNPFLRLGAGIILCIIPIWFFVWVTYDPVDQLLDLRIYLDGATGLPCVEGAAPDSAESIWLNAHGRDAARLCAIYRSEKGPFGTTDRAILGIVLNPADTGEARFAVPRRTRGLYLQTDSATLGFPEGFRRLARQIRIRRAGANPGEWLVWNGAAGEWMKIGGAASGK